MRILSYLLLLISLVACNKPAPNTLVVGTIAGPESELIKTAQQVAEHQYGLKVKVVEFNEYNLPNAALQEGSLDVNIYQHLPYLKAAIQAHGYQLEAIGKTFIYPMGIYSKKFKSLADIPNQSIIAIPNDPSNELRAFLLLQQAGLITLKNPDTNNRPELATNPKNLIFKEMDAAQLPRALADVSAAVINTTYALPAGLSLTQDTLFIEHKDSPYANLIVIKQGTLKRPQLELFIKALHSSEVSDKARELFGASAVPAW